MRNHTHHQHAPSSVVLVRPHSFTPNQQTRADNGFQRAINCDAATVANSAYEQHLALENALKKQGVEVSVFEDKSFATPDSVFPNNWFSTHSDGTIGIYPMYAPNRRMERRIDIINKLKAEYVVNKVIDYSPSEREGKYLEGTGAMVLDHITRKAYVIPSKRASESLVKQFCEQFNYDPIFFDAKDINGNSIYHTNVFMSIATEFAVLAPSMISNKTDRTQVISHLLNSGRDIVELSQTQVEAFAGNCIELTGENGRILALSQTAFDSLDNQQKMIMENSTTLLPVDVSTIEMAGGSVRCMIAGIHLPNRRRVATIEKRTPRQNKHHTIEVAYDHR